MIGFDSLSDYVFPKFWLKTLARFFFQFILYLSVLVFHKGGVGGGGGCYVMVSSTFFCQSWTEISLSRAGLHTNKISNNSCSFKGFRFSVFIHSPTRMMLTDAEVLKFFLLDILFYPSRCGKEKTLNISFGIVVRVYSFKWN